MNFVSKRNKYKLFSSIIALSSVLILPNFAFAQDAKPEDKKPETTTKTEEKKGETVTITGQKPVNRIDKQVYDVKDDVGVQTGTATDALNKVPSVVVDNDGNVTLRGNSNVSILINGKQSALTKGDNRAATLQSLAGGDIESIEVMTNPSSAFSSEGSGGIINLVLKKNRRPGKYITLTSSVGSNDRLNANLVGTYSVDKFTLTGGLSYRRDGRSFKAFGESTRINTITGMKNTSVQDVIGSGTMESVSGNIGLDYNLTANDTLGFQISFASRERKPVFDSKYWLLDNNNNLTKQYIYHSDQRGPRDDASFAISYEHKFKDPTETLKTDFRFSSSDGPQYIEALSDISFPAPLQLLENKTLGSDTKNYVLSLDYTKPIKDDVLTTGVQIILDDNLFDNKATITDLATNITSVNNNQTSKFSSYQLVHAAYFQYQKPLGEKWTAQAGIRIENTEIQTQRIDTGVFGSSHYVNVSPSAFLSYVVNSNAKIRANYSRRLQRPQAQDLNPTRIYIDAQNISSGNSGLRPQTTDSFEIGYEYSKGTFNYQVRGFYRLNDNIITSYTQYIDATTILTSRINGGKSQAGGVEFNLSRKFGDKLNLNLNSVVSYTEIDAIGPSDEKRTGTTIGGRLSLDYSLTKKDRLQLNAGTRGKTYTPQGFTTPQYMVNLSYRHQFTPFASLMVNVTDPFGMGKFKTITDSDTIKSTMYRSMEARTFYVGFNITLGQRPANLKDNPTMMPGPPIGNRPPGMPPH